MNKISVWTILLILLSLYLLINTWIAYDEYKNEIIECEQEAQEKVQTSTPFTDMDIINMNLDQSNLLICFANNQDFEHLYFILRSVSILSIIMAIFSWRIDNLKKKV